MKIEIVGPGCMRCMTTEDYVRLALGQLEMTAEITHIKDREECRKRGVTFTPALFIDGQMKSSGRVPEVHEIERWLEETAAGLTHAPSIRR